jgi:flavin reductase (DIM6/NTAB) family NADH-FMN oxidoreductase RutF
MQVVNLVNPTNGSSTATMFIGHVKYIHVRKDVLNDQGLVDPGKLKPVARMGDISYARTTEGYRIERPSWAAVGGQIESRRSAEWSPLIRI